MTNPTGDALKMRKQELLIEWFDRQWIVIYGFNPSPKDVRMFYEEYRRCRDWHKSQQLG